jgi:hypothetical protein
MVAINPSLNGGGILSGMPQIAFMSVLEQGKIGFGK